MCEGLRNIDLCTYTYKYASAMYQATLQYTSGNNNITQIPTLVPQKGESGI